MSPSNLVHDTTLFFLASIIECLSFGLYSGLVGWFGLQAIARPRLESFEPLIRCRVFLALALATGVLALGVSVQISRGGFHWSDFPVWGQQTLGILFSLVGSHIVLASHTLPRLSQLDTDSAQLASSLLRARLHMAAHCLLVVALWVPWLSTFR